MEQKKWTVDGKRQVVCSSLTPSPLQPGHVQVQVHAICLLPLDCSKSGYSFAGTVVSSYVDSAYKIGSRVWGFHATNQSDYATLINVPEWSLHKMKTNLSFGESATLGGPALLACHALQIARLPASGKPRILIHGGHVSIATFLIQAARVMKCEVECTVPLEHKEECRNLGVTEFIDLIDGQPAGLTLASFRGRRERNFHLVVDCLGDDVSLYDSIEKYTHEGSKYVTLKERSVSWGGFFKRLTTSVPRDYIYLSAPLTPETAAKRLEVVSSMLNHPDFIGIEIQDEYSIEDLVTALSAVESNTGFGCTVVEVVAPDSSEFEQVLDLALAEGQLPIPESVPRKSKSSIEVRRRASPELSDKKNKFTIE